MATLFEYIEAIYTNKQQLIVDEESYKNYPTFMVLRGLSNNVDTVMQANEMNLHPELPKNMINDFLLHSVTKKKRYSKWAKKGAQSDDLELVSDYYNLSMNKAESVLSLLTKDQLKFIREQTITGGRKKP